MQFSDEQEKVITASRSNMLVSAAAGSGKTTVLVERIVNKIINGDMHIDEVLVVTFTKEAANNMRMKMEADLNKKLSSLDESLKNTLKEEIDRLSGSYIQTMHSFCNRALSESSYLLGADAIEPGSMVIDENTKKILWSSSAANAIDIMYDRMSKDFISEDDKDDFSNLVFSMGGGKKDDGLVSAMCSIYNTLRSLPNYLDVLDACIEKREQDDANNILTGSDIYLNANRDLIIKALSAADLTMSIPLREETKKKSAKTVPPLNFHEIANLTKTALGSFPASKFDSLSETEKFDCINQAYQSFINLFKGEKLAALKAEDEEMASVWGPIATLVLMFKDRIGLTSAPTNYGATTALYELPEEYKYFAFNGYDELMNRQKRRTSCARAVVNLIKIMDEQYRILKSNISGLDYSDLEHLCLKAFESEEVSSIYKNKFKEIYIDEYQDNTTLQDAIVAKIANDNVFCVGDVKQSIYKFRHANPKMFTNKADLYRENMGGTLMELSQNFRSTPEILDFVNVVFGQLMSKDASEIGYIQDNHMMTPNENTPHGPVPEVILIDTKEKYEAESGEKYGEVELLSRQTYLKVVELSKDYNYKDMYVLTKTKDASSDIAEYLKSMGIPARSIVEQSVFADNEIIGLCNLIFIMANENRDECMAGVMLSPYRFSNFTPDELATICTFDIKLRYMNLIVKVREYAKRGDNEELQNRCALFVDTIDSLRSESVIRNISDLMELIFMETGIKATAREEGSNELVKLTVFKNWICDSFLARRCDISDVAFAIEDIRGKVGDDATIEVEDFGENFVRCMNYHKSKGLEKECVIIADTDGSGGGSGSGFVKFREDKLVLSDYLETTSQTFDSLESLEDKREESLADNAETIRLLYVAYTRAKENLTIIRCKNISDNKTKFMGMLNALSEEPREISANYYDKYSHSGNLIVSSLVRLAGKDGSDNLAEYVDADVDFKWKSDFDGVQIKITNGSELFLEVDKTSENYTPVYVKEDADLDVSDTAIYGLLEYDDRGVPTFETYRFADSVNTAAKTSVSALKKLAEPVYEKEDDIVLSESDRMRNSINLQVLGSDDYLSDDSKLSASDFGTVIHKVMHFADLDAISKNPAGVKNQLELLLSDGILTEVELRAAERFSSHIASFATGDLGKRLINGINNNKAMLERPIECAIRINPERDDYQLVQGVIDALLIENDGAVIIDYKTDNVKTDDIDEINRIVKERHKDQLDLYAAAVEKSGIHVKEKYIRLLRKDMDIKI